MGRHISSELSVEADRRKSCDPAERNKHFIDIDDYPRFFDGSLPHSYDAMVATYGVSRVQRNGIVPWAIEANMAQLVAHFRAGNWSDAVKVAADIGHYAGDLHSPLHLTVNYDGQLSGQRGVHSRHESRMTARYLTALTPAAGDVEALARRSRASSSGSMSSIAVWR